VDRLILVRHAETTYNAQGLMNPDSRLDALLSAAGERAARELGQSLASEPIDIAVVSPRLRTRRTAELLLAGRAVPLLELDELAEISVGSFEGSPVEAFREWVQANSLGAAPPGGESVLDAVSRYLTGLRRIQALPQPVVLAVLHNLPMRIALNAHAGDHPLAGPLKKMPHAARADMTAAELSHAIETLAAWGRSGSSKPANHYQAGRKATSP
jgi:broad specificity phosphatase PhoE